jgi:hypothetical protein
MLNVRHVLLACSFLGLATLTVEATQQNPPLGLTWDKGSPKAIPVGQLMVIEGDAHYVAPTGYTIDKVRFRTQACKAGLPGVADTSIAAEIWPGDIVPGSNPGPLGFAIYSRPKRNNLTAIFDANKAYICTWIVDITDDNGKKTADVELAPNPVAPLPPAGPGGGSGSGCEGVIDESEPPTDTPQAPRDDAQRIGGTSQPPRNRTRLLTALSTSRPVN